MTTTVDTARRVQKQDVRFVTFHCCPACDRILSIPEIIERHCERCDAQVQPKEVREAA
ncbi:hypothetical protein [Rhizobium redzepovicii]|uniref:hypothetical protein n=1 Tax=Rhizobium redzepovicii TaxID=2867518 RepID=UPI00287281F7|nr:hypothetical protein [Rhizobium redzepovicii]MDR9781624.1 hypothetical protein [Rhizobium redzepovicii]